MCSEWAAAYQNTEEYPQGFWLECEGALPEGLTGTYFRNGPGLFSHGKDKIAHPFDGHGLVASIVFSKGKAFFRSRYVRTKEFCDEVEQKRVLYKGTFGTLIPGGPGKNFLQISPRNVANTGLLTSRGRCYALFEAGQPHSLDPQTLETIGLDSLGGTVPIGAPFSTFSSFLDSVLGFIIGLFRLCSNLPHGSRIGGEAVCAHPVADPSTGSIFLFSFCLQLSLLARSVLLCGWRVWFWWPGLTTRMNIREFDQDMKQLTCTPLVLPGYCFLHDMGITASHFVVCQNPVRLSLIPLLLGTLCPAHCIHASGQALKIHLIQRPAGVAGTLAMAEPKIQKGPGREPAAVNLTASSGVGNQATHCQQQADQDVGSTIEETASSCQESGKRRAQILPIEHADVSHPSDEGECSPLELSCDRQTVDSHDSGFVFHQANAYEREGGQHVIVDCIRYAYMPDFQQAGSSGQSFVEVVDPEKQPISQLYRYQVDSVTGRVTSKLLTPRAMEFPAINPDFTGREHRFVYTAAALHPTKNMPQQALAKVDAVTSSVTMWSQGVHYYVGEPVFVPSPSGELRIYCNPKGVGEDDGWIISVCYDAARHTSECVVLAAQTMDLLARLPLDHALPHGLHGAWDPDCHAPDGTQ